MIGDITGCGGQIRSADPDPSPWRCPPGRAQNPDWIQLLRTGFVTVDFFFFFLINTFIFFLFIS